MIPLIGFLGVWFVAKDLLLATAVLMVLLILTALVEYWQKKTVKPMTLVTLALVLLFGGLTIWLQDERFIKMKPTILYGLFALVLWGGLLMQKPLVQHLLQHSVQLEKADWLRLSRNFALFFLLMAVANEIIWRTLPTSYWALFKFPGSVVLMVGFMLTQIGILKKGMVS